MSSHTGRPTEPLSRPLPQPLPQLDELLLDGAAAKVGVEDGGGVDELGGRLELAGMEVGQRQTIPGLEPRD